MLYKGNSFNDLKQNIFKKKKNIFNPDFALMVMNFFSCFNFLTDLFKTHQFLDSISINIINTKQYVEKY